LVANEVVELLHELYTPHLEINRVLISQVTFVPRFVLVIFDLIKQNNGPTLLSVLFEENLKLPLEWTSSFMFKAIFTPPKPLFHFLRKSFTFK